MCFFYTHFIIINWKYISIFYNSIYDLLMIYMMFVGVPILLPFSKWNITCFLSPLKCLRNVAY
jgi:hypothetical protein